MPIQTFQSASLKKTISILFFLFLFYVLPLAAKPELILDIRILFLAFVCTVLFSTQPRLSFSESKEKKETDRYTIWLIIIVSSIGQISSILEWAYFPIVKTENNWSIIIGASFMIIGTAFRYYAINVLGKYFSAAVQIKREHEIITRGPYRYLRHPSYTGAYIAMLGTAILLQSMIGVMIFGIGMLIVYRFRIKAEEEALNNNFKSEYLDYCAKTYKMFPLVW